MFVMTWTVVAMLYLMKTMETAMLLLLVVVVVVIFAEFSSG